MTDKRTRDWCYTLNNYTDEDYHAIDSLVSTEFKYHITAKEVGESGTSHLQGYIYFANAKSMSAVKKILGKRCHLEAAKGSPQQAAEYCKKEGDWKERGTLPEKQGKRSDLDDVRDWIKEGKGMRDIVDVAKSYQSIKMAEVLLKYKEIPRNFKPNVVWYYGSSGCGKTKTAYALYPDCYRKTNSSGKWWDGYDAHENVLLDDVKDTTREFYSILLELLDRYEVRVEAKGSSRQFLAKNIVVTSISHPFELYQYIGEAKELLRRIDNIIEIEE